MKRFDSKSKNLAYLGYRIISPIFDPIKFYKGITGYVWYLRDLIKFKVKNPKIKIKFKDLNPQLHDKTSKTSLDAHYFYQQLWLFENVLKNKPKEHVDVGSTYQMSGYLSKIVPTTFIDIRPIDAKLENLKVLDASILKLPYPDKAIEEFSRILRVGGTLILTAPFCSQTHFAPYHFCTGFNIYWYQEVLNRWGFKIKEFERNGNYFDFVLAELVRLPLVLKKHSSISIFSYLLYLLILPLSLIIWILSKVTKKSEDQLCFGYHVLAEKV